MKKILLIVTLCLLTVLYSCKEKNYDVSVSGSSVYVTMHALSKGMITWGQVSLDGYTKEDVEKEIFNKIRSNNYDGNYDVYVTVKYMDSHGNYSSDGNMVKVSTLNGADVKQYSNYSNFHGKAHLENAY